jgi:hypothetical protein
MTTARTKAVIGAVVTAVALALAGTVFLSGAVNSCGMQKNDAPVAFCETFDHPFPVTNRSGQLDGTLWGVSRVSANDNFGKETEAWSSSTIDACDGSHPAQPDGSDVIVCNGQLRESSDDQHGVSTLAIYPKQPFDFAGRTGTVAFDVTNDSYGTHAYWPEFWLTDQPTPAPFEHGGPPCDLCSLPRNGLGIAFAASWPAGQGLCSGIQSRHWMVDNMVIVRNYVPQHLNWIGDPPSIHSLGCATESSGPNGALNHIEMRIAQNQIDVWATDAGRRRLTHLASVSDANLTFTRGLIWLEDNHYNASKSDAPGPDPDNHTFAWDNVAFDGPAPYRDLSFDVLDSLTPAGGRLLNLGWLAQPSSPVSLNTLPMTAANIAAAKNALLMFNFGYNPISMFSYTINGHVESAPSPFPPESVRDHSVALPVPLADLVPGVQNIVLSGDQGMIVANVNIVLVAAGTVPGVKP